MPRMLASVDIALMSLRDEPQFQSGGGRCGLAGLNEHSYHRNRQRYPCRRYDSH